MDGWFGWWMGVHACAGFKCLNLFLMLCCDYCSCVERIILVKWFWGWLCLSVVVLFWYLQLFEKISFYIWIRCQSDSPECIRVEREGGRGVWERGGEWERVRERQRQSQRERDRGGGGSMYLLETKEYSFKYLRYLSTVWLFLLRYGFDVHRTTFRTQFLQMWIPVMNRKPVSIYM